MSSRREEILYRQSSSRHKHKSRRHEISRSRSRSKNRDGSRHSYCHKSHKKESKHRHKRRIRSRDRSRERRRSESSISSLSSVSTSSDEETKESRRAISNEIAKEQVKALEERDETFKKMKEEKKRKKEYIKSLETPEQKRLRRMAKKEAKEKKRKELMGWDEECMGYTNTDNPFGDTNLLKTFVWSKKYEKMGIKDIDPEQIEHENKVKLVENKMELEKVKQRRLEREREKEARLEEASLLQRQKEAEQFIEWEKQEDTFHLKQAKLRSKLRIDAGRGKPIDLLARYINTFRFDPEDKESQVDPTYRLSEPYFCLNGLRINDLLDLQEDIKVYMELDNEENLSYWKDLQIIVEDELHKLKKFQDSKENKGRDGREGINSAVNNEVLEIFKGKTPSQLTALQKQIETKINSRSEGIDISYWESLLYKLKAHMARARLKELHDQNMKNLKRRRENMKTTAKSEPKVNEVADEKHVKPETSQELNYTTIENIDYITVNNYLLGNYSPQRIPLSQIEDGIQIVDPDEDFKNREKEKQKVIESIDENKDGNEDNKLQLNKIELAFEKEAKKGMSGDERAFNKEEKISQSKEVLAWSDKYRPRKPRYFNRVHTGFEWNKYNQTHYDVDNPPPKIVQGYKFNIFYPDLIDKGRTPTYTVKVCLDNRDFSIIRFSSGPPYEDIAFKIVNREWNFSYKSGFRCQFHNNILQLWFHFKRYRYRR